MWVVGVSQNQFSACIPDQFGSFFKIEWVLGNVAFNEVLVEGFLPCCHNFLFHQVVRYVRPAKHAVN